MLVLIITKDMMLDATEIADKLNTKTTHSRDIKEVNILSTASPKEQFFSKRKYTAINAITREMNIRILVKTILSATV